MKWKILLLCFGLSAGMLLGQDNVSVNWGPEFKESSRYQMNGIIGHYKGGIIVGKGKGGGSSTPQLHHQLDYFDRDFKLVKSENHVFRAKGEPLVFDFSFQIKDRMYIFGSLPQWKERTNELFMQEIDPEKLAGKTDFQPVMRVPKLTRREIDPFNYQFAQDSSHVMIFASIREKRKDFETFHFTVFDQEMKQLWSRKITMPYKADLFDVEGFDIDNEGNVYLLGVKYKEQPRAIRKGDPNYIYEILVYGAENGSDRSYEINEKTKFLSEMAIGILPNKDIICSGFYSEEGTRTIAGTFFMSINGKSKAIEGVRYKEFELDFITQNMTNSQERRAERREAKGKENELYSYKLRNLVMYPDGRATLIAEQYYIRVVTSFNSVNNVTTTITYYYYNDIIAVNISAEGEIEWAKKVPKLQVSTNDGGYYSSFAGFFQSGELNFIYNDRADNLEKTTRLRNYSLNDRKGIVVLATLDANGDLTRQPLFPNKEIEAITIPKLSRQTGPNEVVLYAKQKRTAQFGRVTFK